MNGFADCLTEYGADYAVTMSRFMGNETLYLRLLGMLFSDENLHKLGENLAAGALHDAFEAAHTLKGVTGNLGLAPLYREICALTEPLRAGQVRDYDADYRRILAEFERVRTLYARLQEVG